jgi:hypothetical protein
MGFHPVMGDYYWGIESQLTDPGDPSDYVYSWKLEDTTLAGAPHVTITDAYGTGRTDRPVPFGGGFTDGAVATYTWDTLIIYSPSDPSVYIKWQLSDGVTMEDGFSRGGSGAYAACDSVDIEPDDHLIQYENPSSPGGTGYSYYSTNLGGALADTLPPSPVAQVALTRTAARRDGGVVMVTIPFITGLAAPGVLGAYVVNTAEIGNTCAVSCNTADDVSGQTTFTNQFDAMVTCYASKMKFAFGDPHWCFKTWQFRTTQFTFHYRDDGFGLFCPVTGDPLPSHYTTVDLRWTVHAYVDTSGPPVLGNVCAQPFDAVVDMTLQTCASFGPSDGNIIAQVGDRPQPCVVAGVSAPHACSGPVLYYDFRSAPHLGFIGADGSNCGANCDCGTTVRPNVGLEMPS